ncbi:biotin--[acetyl-CoA-carboxylase] ligase [Flavihumibacter petaseus]|uniref:biotin--[acetyl-CoA-carboxylase] ligase n=1 Tax=Flavihumibacter petaseus TaxID=549295 RepID=UPI000907F4C0|nr:biotin--[acetyl-CoA-carboxylase] ligase [Flavihumibacter petaseus]
MAKHSHGLPIGHSLHILESVDSSNNYAMGQAKTGQATHGEGFFALEQTAGKGQRGKRWSSRPGENIMVSFVLETTSLPAPAMFTLNMALALGICDWFRSIAGDETSIKWPNDIYWRDRKAGGLLVENSWVGDIWQFAIAGMGINVNQSAFGSDLPNAVSARQISGRHFDVLQETRALASALEHRWAALKAGDFHGILDAYNKALYKLGEVVTLRRENVVFQTRVTGVNAQGELLCADAVERTFPSGTVEWML